MCNTDQLREAYKNVAYSADSTWSSDLCAFQRANMNLYLRERHIKSKTSRWERLTPRTVRDCIPTSKLAQYSNYEYDEARELSYSPTVIKFERLGESFDGDETREPWMLDEIDDLVIGFLCYKDYPVEISACNENHENLPCSKDFCEMSYESPFLEALNFEEMALKLKIASQSLKKIWDTKYFPYYGWHPVTQAKDMILFKSPICQMFASVNDDAEENDWLKNITEMESSTSQIKALTHSFKEQNTWIFKKQNSARAWLEPNQDSVDLSSHRRLYSAVLQGTSQNQRSSIANFQFPPTSDRHATDCSTKTLLDKDSSASFLGSAVKYPSTLSSISTVDKSVQLNRRMVEVNSLSPSGGHHQGYSYYHPPRPSVQTTPSTSTPVASVFANPTNYTNYQYLPQTSHFFNPRVYQNNFIPNTSVLNFRQTNYFPLMLQNAATPYAQSSFFNYPRGSFPSYGRTVVYPQRPQMVVPSTGWILQQPVKIAPPSTINVLPHRHHAHGPGYYRAANSNKPRPAKPCSLGSSGVAVPPQTSKDDAVNQEMENIVAKTVNAVLDDPDPFVPVTGTPSDELELQALEQYSPSNDNVFQELERQAAEQYDSSENWVNPPKCDDARQSLDRFGGLRVRLVRFRCVEEVLGLGCSDTVKAEGPNLVLGISDS